MVYVPDTLAVTGFFISVTNVSGIVKYLHVTNNIPTNAKIPHSVFK